MKTKSSIYLILFAAFIFTSCTKNFSVQKRKYNKGFYIACNNKNKNNAPKVVEKKNDIVEETPDIVYVSVSNEFTFEKEATKTKTKKVAVVTPPTKKHENIKLKDVFYKPMNIKTYSEKMRMNSESKKQNNKKSLGDGGLQDFGIYCLIYLIAALAIFVICLISFLDAGEALLFGLVGGLVVVAIVALIVAIIKFIQNPPSFSDCFNNCFLQAIGAAIVGIIGSIFGGCR